MISREVELVTGDRRVVDVTDHVAAFVDEAGADGLLHVFLPHATCGLAILEVGAGSDVDLEAAMDDLLPRDDRWRHRHGSRGHGADHVWPAIVSPSLTLPVVDGRVPLGTWQSVVVVDPNVDNPRRTLRLSLLEG